MMKAQFAHTIANRFSVTRIAVTHSINTCSDSGTITLVGEIGKPICKLLRLVYFYHFPIVAHGLRFGKMAMARARRRRGHRWRGRVWGGGW